MENIERKIRLAGLGAKLVEYLRIEIPRPALNYRTVRAALTDNNGSDLHNEIARLTPVFLEKELDAARAALTAEAAV